MASETIIQGDHAAIAEQALMFRRYWDQEKTRAERLDNDHRALRRELGEAEVAVAELLEVGQFLADRLDDFDRSIEDGQCFREFSGHVSPAFARFKDALSRHQAGLGKGEE